MNVVSIAGVMVVISIIALMLKQYKPEYAVVVAIVSSVVVLGILIREILPVLDVVKNLMDRVSFSSEHIEILFKCLGICYIAKFATDICIDCGQTALASKVDLVGKIAILVVSIPLFVALIDIASKAMNI